MTAFTVHSHYRAIIHHSYIIPANTPLLEEGTSCPTIYLLVPDLEGTSVVRQKFVHSCQSELNILQQVSWLLKEKPKQINFPINAVNTAQIMDIMRSLVHVIKRFFNPFESDPICSKWVYFNTISVIYIAFIVILFFTNLDKTENRTKVVHLSTAISILAVLINGFFYWKIKIFH